MKKNCLKNLIIALSFLAIIFAGCASTKASDEDPYYKSNIGEFSTHTLSNKIPVVVKKSGSQIVVVRVVFEGGTPLIAPEKAGIEGLLLNLMLHGGREYSYEEIQKMQYDKTFTLNSSSGKDYSVMGLKCIKKDFDSVFSVFSDAVNSPLLEQSDFDKFILQEKDGVQRSLSDPSEQLSIELYKTLYDDSSYKTSPDFTEQSVNSVTLEDVKAHYKKLMDSNRIKIVVVGNFEGEELQNLIAKLDGAFGSIAAGGYKKPAAGRLNFNKADKTIINPNAGASAYSAGLFYCPNRYDKDYVAFAISLMYLDDIFFSHVREEGGAVYSIGSGVLSGRNMAGVISAYKISDKENIRRLISESIAMFPDKKGVEAKLDQYKNKYITTLFDSGQNAAGVAANIVTSLEYSNFYGTYLKRSKQVQDVSAKDVIDAYKKYVGDGTKIFWVTVTGD